jgi:TolB protein
MTVELRRSGRKLIAFSAAGLTLAAVVALAIFQLAGARVPPWQRLLAAHGSTLAVSVVVGGRSVIMLADGSGTRQLEGNGDQVTPRFSPDGRRLAYAEREGNDFEIVVLDLPTRVARRVTNNEIDDVMPTWDAEGRRLVWSGVPKLGLERANESEIYVADLDSSAVKVLTRNERMDVYPVFAPDGKEVIFESGRADALFGLWVVDMAGNERPLLYEPTQTGNGIPDVFGRRVLFERTTDAKGTELYSAWIDRDGAMRPTHVGTWILKGNPTPRFSPDGRYAASHGPANRGPHMAVRVTQIDPPYAERVHEHSTRSYFLPRWAASGNLLAVEDRLAQQIVLLSLDGTAQPVPMPGPIRGQRFMEIWNFDIR